MKKYTGKIASLPLQIRCEVSKRIIRKETPASIANWLNDQFPVLEVLEEKFEDDPIRTLDVEEWKNGGFLEWIPDTDYSEHALAMSGHASDMRAAGLSTDDLFMVVLAKHAQLIRGMDILPHEVVLRRMDMVERLTKSVLSLRRSEQAEARKEIELGRLELAREKQRSISESSESSASSPALSSAENPASLRNARASATPALKSAEKPDQSVDQLSAPKAASPLAGDPEIAPPEEASAPIPTGAASSKPPSGASAEPEISAPRVENHDSQDSENPAPAISTLSELESPLHSFAPPSTRTGVPSTASARNPFGLL